MWVTAVVFYGIADSGLLLLMHEAPGLQSHYPPLVHFGLIGLLILKGGVLLGAAALFPLCDALSYQRAPFLAVVFSTGLTLVGGYLAIQKLPLILASGAV